MINKVILFGDSVLFGIGASNRSLGCGRILKTLLPQIPVIIKGRNRDTTEDALQRLSADVIKNKECAAVIILFGNNDCKLQDIDEPVVSLPKYEENLRKIVTQIKSNNKIPILSNLQPIDSEMFYETLPGIKKLMVNIDSPKEWQRGYSLACGRVAARENIRLADIMTMLDKHGNSVLDRDGLHPNDKGHRMIAQKFFDVLGGYF